MAVVERRYAVPGWGVGELWLADGVLLAHDFRFRIVAAPAGAGSQVGPGAGPQAAPQAAPHEGAHVPPTGTVATIRSHDSDCSVSSSYEPAASLADVIVERVTSFLAGEATEFGDLELDLDWATPFQRALADSLRTVPRGEVVSYGELAALAGRPGAARASGAFCAANRFAFVVPCHRVVAASGLGGYGSAGLEVKRRLLELEGVSL